MKKAIATALILGSLLALTACATEFTCDTCGQTKKSKKHKEELLGQKIEICDDCYDSMKALGDLAK